MKQIKIISATTTEQLQTQVNMWLMAQAGQEVTIHDMQFTYVQGYQVMDCLVAYITYS